MTQLKTKGPRLNGDVVLPGDKSLSHRALMFGAVATGTTVIDGLLQSDDVATTQQALRALGVPITVQAGQVTIKGVGWQGFKAPANALDMGNSGTTTRLLLGLLARQPFSLTLVGDASLSQRPMRRVLDPLTLMGATAPEMTTTLPLVWPAHDQLKGMTYTLPVASAQVKSAVLLAGLQAQTPTTVIEPLATRDHTENMLAAFGVSVTREEKAITVQPGQTLTGTQVTIPGDVSSAAFWLAAGLLVPGSKLTLQQVGMNPTRTGFIRAIERMGGKVASDPVPDQLGAIPGEPMHDLHVQSMPLHAANFTAADMPSMIDELPLLVLLATQAQGVTVITGAEELRHKETDRIAVVTAELTKLGAKIEARADGFIVHGGTPLAITAATTLDSHGDHRIGMMLAIAALITENPQAVPVTLAHAEAIAVSYPTFLPTLAKLLQG